MHLASFFLQAGAFDFVAVDAGCMNREGGGGGGGGGAPQLHGVAVATGRG